MKDTSTFQEKLNLISGFYNYKDSVVAIAKGETLVLRVYYSVLNKSKSISFKIYVNEVSPKLSMSKLRDFITGIIDNKLSTIFSTQVKFTKFKVLNRSREIITEVPLIGYQGKLSSAPSGKPWRVEIKTNNPYNQQTFHLYGIIIDVMSFERDIEPNPVLTNMIAFSSLFTREIVGEHLSAHCVGVNGFTIKDSEPGKNTLITQFAPLGFKLSVNSK